MSSVATTIARLARRYGMKCFYCGLQLSRSAEFLLRPTLDHVVPRSRGGRYRRNNLVLACRSCNARKNNRTLAEVILDPEVRAMFARASTGTPNIPENIRHWLRQKGIDVDALEDAEIANFQFHCERAGFLSRELLA